MMSKESDMAFGKKDMIQVEFVILELLNMVKKWESFCFMKIKLLITTQVLENFLTKNLTQLQLFFITLMETRKVKGLCWVKIELVFGNIMIHKKD